MYYDSKTTFQDCKRINLAVAKKFYHYNELTNDPVISDYGSWSTQIADRMTDCCKSMAVYKNKVTNDFRMSRHRCKNKFCPICNHVNSTKTAAFLQQDYNAADKDKTIYWSVVFTMPNVTLDDFGQGIADLSKAFSLWNGHYRRTLHYVAGLRTFEFTYNKKTGLFHPHIHLLLKFNLNNLYEREILIQKLKNFNFGRTFAEYLPTNRIGLADVYTPAKIISGSNDLSDEEKLLRIRQNLNVPLTVFDSKEYNPNRSTLFEFSKYITKFNKLLALDPISFVNVYRALNNFKIRHFLGEWRSWQKQLDIESGDVWVDARDIIQNANWEYYCTLYLLKEEQYSDDFKLWLINHNIITQLE